MGVVCLAAPADRLRPRTSQAFGRHRRHGYQFAGQSRRWALRWFCITARTRLRESAHRRSRRIPFRGAVARSLLRSRQPGQLSFRRSKKDILVQPGMRSILNVNLNTLFSSIQICVSARRERHADDRRLEVGLRTAIGHASGDAFLPDPWLTIRRRIRGVAVFSDTRGMLKVSARRGRLATGVGSTADMGTAFALATSLFGSNQLQVSGNLGYGSQTGVPSRRSAPRTAAPVAVPRSRSRCGSCSCRAAWRRRGAESGIAHAAHDLGELRRSDAAHRQPLSAVRLHAGFGFLRRPAELFQPVCAADLLDRRRRRIVVSLHLRKCAARPGRKAPLRIPACSAISATSACSRAFRC